MTTGGSGVPLRVALALIVIAALTFVGVQAWQRIDDGDVPPVPSESAAGVAEAWAIALAAGDVDGLVALAAPRADVDELQAAHEQILPALGEVTVAVTEVVVDDNAADAQLEIVAAPVPGAAWTWAPTMELIRARGEWSVDWSPDALHPDLRPGWRLRAERREGSRAPVLDREGRALSRTGDVVEVGVQPGRLPDRERTLLTVAGALPEAYEPLQELLDRTDLRDDWYYPLTSVPIEVADEAWTDLITLPGFLRRDTEAGTGPANAAADVVGVIGVDEDGRRIGTSGLELVYDDRLQGSATTEVRLLDPDGGDRGLLYEFQADVSPALTTTLDIDVQQVVEQALSDLEEPLGVVVVDSASGGVLAVASKPSSGFNRALEGRYPPSLVAGAVPLAAALLDGGTTSDPLSCPASGTGGGVTVSTIGQRSLDDGVLSEALTGACDVGVAQLGAAVGGDALTAAVGRLGLDRPVELPVEAAGFTWPPTTSPEAHASAAVGHGQVQSSALAAASLAAAVARGAPAPPALLVEDVAETEPWPGGLADGLREAMRLAGERGEVAASGVRVAGLRTASGRVGGDPAPTTGWWVGFLEGDAPDVALAVVFEGDSDGRRAAAVADRVVEALAR